MKPILISIQRPHTDNIKALIKNIEVRKSRPKQDTPFPCYIYETKAKGGCGKIIGEFECDNIYDCRDLLLDDICLTVEEWLKYTNGHKGIVYGWHISDLKIYDKPKELSEFSKYGFDEPVPLKCPPQSWMYVEGEAVKALEDMRKEDEEK